MLDKVFYVLKFLPIWVLRQIYGRPKIIFVDGVAGTGKSGVADESFDLTTIAQTYDIFISENHNDWTNTKLSQFLYDSVLTTRIIRYLRSLPYTYGCRNDVICDRSPFSQIVYSILFRCRGETNDPEQFKQTVEEKVFQDDRQQRLINTAMAEWMDLMETQCPSYDIYLVWVLAKNPISTAKTILSREGFDAKRGWNLHNYVENQNYLFTKLANTFNIRSSTVFAEPFLYRNDILNSLKINTHNK